MVTELQRQPVLDEIHPIELIRNKIETERIEEIPLSNVVTDFAIVDISHAYELGRSIGKKRGQLTPILVRAREEEGKVVYDVMDGFHRAEGMRNIGAETIKATVVYGCSDEEMFDLRILAASSVKAVQFARMADWMTRAFETTEWAKKGVAVAQAFGLTFSDSKSTRLDLDSEELVQIKTWVTEKCDRWGKNVGSTYLDLLVVSNADPDLVRQVRVSGGSVKSREGQITPKRFKAVILKFPGRENYGTQNAVLKFAAKNRLYEKEIAILINRITRYVKPEMTEEEVNAILSRVKLDTLAQNLQPEVKSPVNEQGLEAPKLEPDAEEEFINEDDSELGYDTEEPDDAELSQMESASLDNDDPEAGFIEGEGSFRHFAGATVKPVFSSGHTNGRAGNYELTRRVSFTNSQDDIHLLIQENKALRDALRSRRDGKSGGWWESAGFLNSEERTIMCALFTEDLDINQISEKYKIAPNRIGLLLTSALTKKTIIRRQTEEDRISEDMGKKVEELEPEIPEERRARNQFWLEQDAEARAAIKLEKKTAATVQDNQTTLEQSQIYTERQHRRVQVGGSYSASDIARVLRVSRQRIHQIRIPLGFPKLMTEEHLEVIRARVRPKKSSSSPGR